jgi:hypothetical protein
MKPGTAAESSSDEKTLEVPPVNRMRNPFPTTNPTQSPHLAKSVGLGNILEH